MRRGCVAFGVPEVDESFGSNTESAAEAGPGRGFARSRACGGRTGMKVRPEVALCLISTVNDRLAGLRKRLFQANGEGIEGNSSDGLGPSTEQCLIRTACTKPAGTDASTLFGEPCGAVGKTPR